MLCVELPEQAKRAYAVRVRKREAETTRVKAATDAEAKAGREKCVSRPQSCEETLAPRVRGGVWALTRTERARRGGRGGQGTYGGGGPC
jgi:hypothetical protein